MRTPTSNAKAKANPESTSNNTFPCEATALPAANYLCYVNNLQSESVAFLNSKHFATVVRIVNHLSSSPNAVALEDWLLTMMRGRPTAERTRRAYAADSSTTHPDDSGFHRR